MNPRLSVRQSQSRPARSIGQQAFSLIEILTVVALLSFIILGLMASFNQTQRAWRTSMTQTDMLEAGRMATDLVARDFVSITPSFQAGVINFDSMSDTNRDLLAQSFPQANNEIRTNLHEKVFFLTRQNKLWRYVGYRVMSPESGLPDSVGTLYRYEVSTDRLDSRNQQWGAFHAENPNGANTLLSPIISGVVHFAVTAYDINGVLLNTNELVRLGLYAPNGVRNPANWNTIIRWGITPQNPGWTFLSNAVPAYVDIELGILEARTAEHAQAMPNAAVRAQYLQSHLGNVHLFRQRIPIRNVDPEAYQ